MEPPRSTGGRTLFVFALFFVSGATALAYQVAWVRSLTLIFGASHEAVGIVLAAFMGGLALGGFVFGRWSERIRRPLVAYGLLEIGIGVVAFALPALLRLADGIYVATALEVEGVPPSLLWMRAALAFALLLLPTFLMGGTLPLLARLLVTRQEQFGLRLSQLYGINTTGAVVGAVGAGFVLLPALGVRSTTLVAIGANLVVGLSAIAVGRRMTVTGGDPTKRGSEAPRPASTPSPPDPWRVWALRLTFAGTAVSGMCALALEVMWMRAISVAVGTTTYSFTVMLAAFLIGIALGSWLHAAFPLRRVSEATQFGAVLAGVGLTSLLIAQWVPHLPRLAVALNANLFPDAGGLRVGPTLLTSFAIMLVPCILMGIAFPLAAQARVRLRERFGASVGEVLGLNTVGAIVGSLAAGFLLIPYLGLQRGMLTVASVNLAYGLVVVGLDSGLRRRRVLLPIAALLALAALLLPFTLPDWDIRQLATFTNNARRQGLADDGRIDWASAYRDADVRYYREGKVSNVSVIDSGSTRAILIDGKSVASDSLTDMQHEFLLGHLPVLLNREPRTAVVIGCGAGITLGSVLAHPSLERVTLVEIEPAVIEGARRFAHVNDGALDDPRLEIVFQDGRNYLRTTNRRFDVITADPIHPWAHGASYLYTTEYYAIAASRLAEGGVMCQWLPLYELSDDNVRSVIASFADNFPHTTLWQTAYDAVLIGSEAPLRLDPQLGSRLAAPAVARQLGRIGIGDPLSFLSELTLDEAAIARISEGARRNTDDNLYLEFSSPLSVGTSEVFDNIRTLDRMRTTLSAVFPDVASLFSGDESVEERLAAYRRSKSDTVEMQIALQEAKGKRSVAPYPAIIERLNAALERAPAYGRPRSLLCLAWTRYGMELLEARRAQDGVNALGQAVQLSPGNAEANFQLGTALADFGRAERAIEFLETATRNRAHFAPAHANLGAALARVGRLEEACAVLERALELRPDSASATLNLGVALLQMARLDEAEARFREAMRLDGSLDGLHNSYAALLSERGRYSESIAMLEQGLTLSPDDIQLKRRLAWLLSTAPDPALRDGPRAVELARQVDRATGSRIPQVMDTLAAALAESGAFEEAAVLAGRAVELAAAGSQTELADEIRARAEGYEAGRTFRLP